MKNANGKILLTVLVFGSLALAQTSPSVVADEIAYKGNIHRAHFPHKIPARVNTPIVTAEVFDFLALSKP